MNHVTKATENRFCNSLKKLFAKLIEDVKNGTGLQHGLTEKVRQFMQSEEVDRYLNKVIAKMARTLRASSATSWRQAASKAHRGQEIYDLMRQEMNGPVGAKIWELISENAAYIKTLPEQWAAYAVQYAARESLKGKRPEEIEAEMRKVIPAHMAKNLKTIARTECAKANAAIVQARAEMCGIKAYFWRSMVDTNTRKSHQLMNGVLVFYDEPPCPEALPGSKEKPYGNYHAGNTFNCRCYQEPVVDESFLPDTVRVYENKRIREVSKRTLLKEHGHIA